MADFEIILTLRAFAQATQLTLPKMETVERAIRVLELKPREFAFRENQHHCFAYQVREGLLKQFYTSATGDEWIKSFTAEGDMFACPFALLRDQPTTFASQALEMSVIEQLDFRVIERLADGSVEWQKVLRRGIEELALIKLQRERDLLTLSAEALYREFARKRPSFANRVPQKDLAAYLGITPVGLSRIVRRARAIDEMPTSVPVAE